MNICEHKLAWRWTDINYAVLPDNVMMQLIPLEHCEAQVHHQMALKLLGKDSLSSLFTQIKINTNELSSAEGTIWLEEQQPILNTEVVLSWDSEAAIKTTWGIFSKYWQEFCYPASDNLMVFSESQNWALLYHHSEEFHFGKSSANA